MTRQKRKGPDAYTVVTERICTLLEQGVAPWKRQWNGDAFAPRNLVSGKAYRGGNPFYLACLGFASPWWLTYRQAEAKGGRVRKGEKGSPVVFWKWFRSKGEPGDPEPKDGDMTTVRLRPMLRYYTVFNVEQCEGVEYENPDAPALSENERIEKAEAIVSGYRNAPSIVHRGGVPCYSPSQDSVFIPELGAFNTAPAYYGTLFHELGHSTGHSTRLARKYGERFGDHAYSREELVAEFTSSFLGSRCGVLETNIDNSAAYLQHWLSALKANPKWVPQAAAAAQKAADRILGEEWTPDTEATKAPVVEAVTV